MELGHGMTGGKKQRGYPATSIWGIQCPDALAKNLVPRWLVKIKQLGQYRQR